MYRQFTVTIVVSVLISTVVALTLSPVMCSLILKPDNGKKKNIVFRKINEWLGIGSNKYVAAVTRTIKHPRRVLSAFGMVLIAIMLIHRIIPTSFCLWKTRDISRLNWNCRRELLWNVPVS